MTIRVFLLDDHEVVRRGLRHLLELEGDVEVVGESGSAAEATRRIPALHPDVALLDVRLPDGSGIDTCRHIRSVDPSIPALIVTSYDDDEALAAAVEAGAVGYVLKNIKGNDLVASVRRAAGGASLIPENRSAATRGRADAGGAEDSRLALLSPQERRILRYIAEGLTNRQIGERVSLAEKTVKNYVTVILRKLGVERRVHAAVFATAHPSPDPGDAGRWAGRKRRPGHGLPRGVGGPGRSDGPAPDGRVAEALDPGPSAVTGSIQRWQGRCYRG